MSGAWETPGAEQAARMCPVCGEYCGVYKSKERAGGVYMRWRFCPECRIEFQTLEVATGYYRTRKKLKKGNI